MAIKSLNDLSQLINQQIESQEDLRDILVKAKVLLDLAINSELLVYPINIVYCYLSVIGDFLQQATKVQDEILMALVENKIEISAE